MTWILRKKKVFGILVMIFLILLNTSVYHILTLCKSLKQVFWICLCKKFIPLKNFSILILQNSFYPDIASASSIFHPTSSFLSKNCTSIRKLPKKTFVHWCWLHFVCMRFFMRMMKSFSHSSLSLMLLTS